MPLLCKKCLILKEKISFYRNNLTCKSCRLKEIYAWKKNNKERDDVNEAAYRARNRERINAARLREYYKDKSKQRLRSAKWRAKNKERIAATNAAWDKANADKACEKFARRRAAKKTAIPKWANRENIKKIYARAQQLTKETGKRWSVDHIVPLISTLVCGLHVENNLALMTLSENCSKHNRTWPDMPEDQCHP